MLVLRWQRLVDEEGRTCPRCGTTEMELQRTYELLKEAMRPLGIEVKLIKEALKAEDFKDDPLKSNLIWINERTLEDWLGATTGSSLCCDVCGDSECRTVIVGGTTYESIPAALIIKAALKAAAEVLPVKPIQEIPGFQVLNRCCG